MRVLAFLALTATPAFAESCPSLPNRAAELGDIYGALGTAASHEIAQSLSAALWKIWLEAPDEQAQELLDTGMRQRQQFDYLSSRQTLGKLVEYCPDYAEGYNQREG